MRIIALRRKPWSSQPPSAAPQQAETGSGQQPAQLAGERMEEDGQEQAGQQMEQDGQQPAAQDVQQPAARLQQPHDPELDAAAEAALADKGCWPADSARLAGQADIVAGAAGAGRAGLQGIGANAASTPALELATFHT